MVNPCRPSFILQLSSSENSSKMVYLLQTCVKAVMVCSRMEGYDWKRKQSRNPCHMRSSKQPMVLQFQQQQHVKEPRCVHFFSLTEPIPQVNEATRKIKQ